MRRDGKTKTGSRAAGVVLAAMALGLLGVACEPAALTVTVNSTADLRDALPGNGVCEATAGAGNCTLRAAIDEANATVGSVAVNVAPGTYELTRSGNDDTNANGDLDVTGKVSLTPQGAVTIETGVCATGVQDRIFHVLGGSLSILSATLQGGQSPAGGGAVLVAGGSFGMTFGTVRSNAAIGNGGGIDVTAGTVTLNFSTVSGNKSGGIGGGVHVASGATANITNSTLSGNTATGPVTLGGGGCPAGTGDAPEPANGSGSATELDAPALASGARTVRDADGLLPVIVQLESAPATTDRAAQADAVADATGDFLADIDQDPATDDIRINRTYSLLPVVAMSVDADALAALQANPEVVSVQADSLSSPTLAQSIPWIGADVVHNAGYHGTGMAVAVLDTGVDGNEPMTNGKVVAEACFARGADGAVNGVGDCPNGSDSMTGAGAGNSCPWFTGGSACWHGTHVASTAAGATRSISGVPHTGVADGSSIIAVNVFSHFFGAANCGAGLTECVLSYNSDQLAGLNWVLSQAGTFNIASVNMSLGGGTNASTCDADARKVPIDQLRAAGIATVIAAGNNGAKNGVGNPGCISTAITVGATSDAADVVASFSQSAPVLDMLAPGQNITAEYPTIPGDPNDYVITADGTSMATPHVAGAFAVLKAAKPSLTVDQMEAALENTGVPVTDTNGLTRPRINLRAAVSEALSVGRGGGLASEGTATLLLTTVTNNNAWEGGGVFVGAGTTTISGSAVAAQVGGNDCRVGSGATLSSGGRNLASDATCWSGGTDIANSNPLFGALAANGGPTQTHLPGAGSPLRNVIPNGEAPFCNGPRDQRLVVRPQGGACDIGSVEV
jgi:CSLREA domain-containing protein